jgi:glycosyltransferase involved in cell wall biosynthesis
MKNPKISIIIPCFNHGQFILETIRSIEESIRKPDYEIIIVNDGSNDQITNNLLKELSEKYTVIFQDNAGLSNARNTGISKSNCDLILTLDADDRLKPGFLYKAIEIFEKDKEIGIIYGDRILFGAVNKKEKAGLFSRKRLLVDNYISSCIVFRKNVWHDVGGYDINLTAYEDWDFNISAATTNWRFHYLPEELFEYRISENSMLRTHKDLNECINFLAKKHGVLYRNEFLKNITIKDRFKSAVIDLFRKFIGRPNY